MTARPQARRPLVITGALYVDMGQQNHAGRWVRPPRARYECLRCRTTEGPVSGAADVAQFVATIRAAHPTRCTTTYEGAQAA
ncbi:hypothetical protein [Streptomyces sp. NRRL S-337]|uniref:hypothetical protein n=1 Tax=Streptomyces sp. NRRL S-337 TaxID=1463900 RepID=UPI0004C69C5A|nr:hypothetical protein [Streptomyces sp. NRRL S-337]